MSANFYVFPQCEVDWWNRDNAVGQPVVVRTDQGGLLATRTTSRAWLAGGMAPVVMVEGVRGCVALDRVLAAKDGENA